MDSWMVGGWVGITHDGEALVSGPSLQTEVSSVLFSIVSPAPRIMCLHSMCLEKAG